jgi:hypothetical protein
VILAILVLRNFKKTISPLAELIVPDPTRQRADPRYSPSRELVPDHYESPRRLQDPASVFVQFRACFSAVADLSDAPRRQEPRRKIGLDCHLSPPLATSENRDGSCFGGPLAA